MTDLKKLREDRAKLVTDARTELDKITDATPETEAKEIEARFDTMMEDADKITARIQREERAEKLQAEIGKPVERESGKEDRIAGGKPESEDTAIKVDEVFTRAMKHGVSFLGNEERKQLAELRTDISPEMRAQAAGTDASGGYTVPEGFWDKITVSMAAIGPMLDESVVNVIRTDSGNRLPWPTTDDTSNKGALLAENTQDTEQDVTFGEKQLDAYTYTSKIVRVSLQLLQDSAFNMETLLKRLFAERIARAANEHLSVGTGSSQPNGIVTASAAGVTAASATAIAADELFDLQHSVNRAYRDAPKAGWMFNDTTLKQIRKLKDGQGNYLWQLGDVRTGTPDTLLDEPVHINDDMVSAAANAKPIIFGDLDRYVTRIVRDLTVLRLAERYADYLQVGFIGFNRIDGELEDTAAVKHMVMAAV